MSWWATWTVQERVGLVLFLIIFGLFACVVVGHIVMSLLSGWAEASVELEGSLSGAEGFTPEALYPVSSAASPRGLGPVLQAHGEPVEVQEANTTRSICSNGCGSLFFASARGTIPGGGFTRPGAVVDVRA